MSDPATNLTRPWYTRPLLWLCAFAVLLVSATVIAAFSARTGVSTLKSHGATLHCDVPEWAIWLEDNVGVDSDSLMWDERVTAVVTYAHKPINDPTLQELARFPSLQVLCLDGCQITDDGLERLITEVEFRDLGVLSISGCDQLTGRGIGMLSSLQSLKVLALQGQSVSGVDFRGFHELWSLSLINVPLMPGALQMIARLPKLTALSIESGDFSDDDLAEFPEFLHLEALHLDSCSVSDSGALEIPNHCPNLVYLTLSNTQITNASLQIIDQLPHLKDLDVTGTGVTSEAIEQLATTNPNLDVYGWEDFDE